MVEISRKTYERNGIEEIVDSDGIHIEKGLDYKICEKLQQNVTPTIENMDMN